MEVKDEPLLSQLENGLAKLCRGEFELTQRITQQYLLLLASCIINDELREEFETNPREVLKIHVPEMKIPEDAEIILDPFERKWSEIRCETPDGVEEKVIYSAKERAFTVESTWCTERDSLPETKVDKRDQENKAHVKIPLNNNYNGKRPRITIILPYISHKSEVVAEYRFQNEKESTIVLSTPC